MGKEILYSIENAIKAVKQLRGPKTVAFIEDVSETLKNCFERDGKVLIAGNGGSLCEALHFSEELTGFFRSFRPALPVIALAEAGFITCTANDLDFSSIFSRGVEAYGKKGDVFIALSTSGNSANLIKALQTAKQLELTTVALLGKKGGKTKGLADFEWIVENFSTSDRIQEVHLVVLHLLVEEVEKWLFGEKRPSHEESVVSQSF